MPSGKRLLGVPRHDVDLVDMVGTTDSPASPAGDHATLANPKMITLMMTVTDEDLRTGNLGNTDNDYALVHAHSSRPSTIRSERYA